MSLFPHVYRIWLVVWNICIFPIILGMSSSQLTHIVQRGGGLNHQPDRIDDGQADYADFPITNIRVDKPMEFVPWDTEKNKKTPLWTGDWDPLGVEGPLGTLISKVDLQAGFP